MPCTYAVDDTFLRRSAPRAKRAVVAPLALEFGCKYQVNQILAPSACNHGTCTIHSHTAVSTLDLSTNLSTVSTVG